MRTITTPDDKKRVLELEQMKQSLERQLQEMTKKVEQQEAQIAMARRDPLTGLRNREGVAEQINHILKQESEGTFFIMDMDNFKSVNDTYGHREGDRVLVRFAQALRKTLDPGDIAARIGGDEFIIFTKGRMRRGNIRSKAASLVRHLERELVEPGRLVRVTVSMGIAQAPMDGVTFEALYENADQALYYVKNDGKNAFRFYDEMKKDRSKNYAPRVSLTQITTKLRENRMEGSFVVEYGSFEKIYRFLERNIERENREVQCVLFTVNESEDAVYDELALQRQMEHLQHAVTSSLRKGDVSTSYSSSQMLILLMDITKENAQIVINRILQRYEKEAGEDAMEILYDAQQIMPEEQVQ